MLGFRFICNVSVNCAVLHVCDVLTHVFLLC